MAYNADVAHIIDLVSFMCNSYNYSFFFVVVVRGL